MKLRTQCNFISNQLLSNLYRVFVQILHRGTAASASHSIVVVLSLPSYFLCIARWQFFSTQASTMPSEQPNMKLTGEPERKSFVFLQVELLHCIIFSHKVERSRTLCFCSRLCLARHSTQLVFSGI